LVHEPLSHNDIVFNLVRNLEILLELQNVMHTLPLVVIILRGTNLLFLDSLDVTPLPEGLDEGLTGGVLKVEHLRGLADGEVSFVN
jgi:hypothetical protein